MRRPGRDVHPGDSGRAAPLPVLGGPSRSAPGSPRRGVRAAARCRAGAVGSVGSVDLGPARPGQAERWSLWWSGESVTSRGRQPRVAIGRSARLWSAVRSKGFICKGRFFCHVFMEALLKQERLGVWLLSFQRVPHRSVVSVTPCAASALA